MSTHSIKISGIPYEAHIQMARMMMELEMFEVGKDRKEELSKELDVIRLSVLLCSEPAKSWKPSWKKTMNTQRYTQETLYRF